MLEPRYDQIVFEDEKIRIAARSGSDLAQVSALNALEKPRVQVTTIDHFWKNQQKHAIGKDYRGAWCVTVTVPHVLKVRDDREDPRLFERSSDGRLQPVTFSIEEIAWSAGYRFDNYCHLLPKAQVEEHLASIQDADIREMNNRKAFDDLQYQAALEIHWKLSEKTARDLGYTTDPINRVEGCHALAIIDKVKSDNDQDVISLASKYGFSVDFRHFTAWDWKRLNDQAILAFNGGEHGYQFYGSVAVLWAPIDLVRKYYPDTDTDNPTPPHLV